MSKQALQIAIDYMNDRLEDHDCKYQRHPATEAERINILADIETVKEALGKQEQGEPVAWLCKKENGHFDVLTDKTCKKCFPVYITPQQRTWVGLTDEEISEFDTWHDNREEEVGWCNPSEIVAYIEAKLKEKNA